MRLAHNVTSGPIVISEWKETLHVHGRVLGIHKPLEIEPFVHSRASTLIYASARNASYLVPM